MFGHNFYFGTTRKCIIYFGVLFNDINITREDADGNVVDVIKVPLSYAPKDRMLARVNSDPLLDKETALVLPRMSFMYNGYTYDGDRHLNTLNKITRKDPTDVNKMMYQYQEVPINIPFSLYIYVKNAEDSTKIMEQIVPFFRPDWTANIQLIPEMDRTWKIPLVLNSMSHEDIPFDSDLTKRRVLIWTLNFTMKALMFGPIKKSPIIKFANTNFYTGTPGDSSDVVSSVQVTPGLDANGNPTTNAAVSISPLLIDLEDDWDYAVTQSGLIITE